MEPPARGNEMKGLLGGKRALGQGGAPGGYVGSGRLRHHGSPTLFARRVTFQRPTGIVREINLAQEPKKRTSRRTHQSNCKKGSKQESQG